ncbi:MAG: hypothetical protein ACOH5I_14045 [Oligoflexus sp.]
MAIQQRFRVHRSGDVVHLHGVLSDTTNFRVIDEMLQGCRYFDCSQILTASWNGLVNFNRYLRETGSHITLTKIPNHIFNYLRLMPDVNNSYTLDQIELNVVDLSSQELLTKNVYLSNVELKRLADDCSRAFLRLNQKEELVGRNRFICPSRFGQDQSQPVTSRAPWYGDNAEQFDFWYDYCNFANMTSFLALDLVESLSSTLCILLKEIELGVESSMAAVRLVDSKVSMQLGSNVSEIIEQVKSSCAELSQFLDGISRKGKDLLLRMQVLADDPEFTDPKALNEILKSFTEVIQSVTKILPKIEDVGASTGANVVKLGVTNLLRQSLDAVADDCVDADTLSQVREILEIMDPLSEDSWPDTKLEFMAQVDSMDKAISDTIILIQGFDLLRQILEHRLAEATEIHKYLQDNGGRSWEDLRQTVFELVGKTLVTDQEKYSCEFFIPTAASNQDDKQSPGDVLLF